MQLSTPTLDDKKNAVSRVTVPVPFTFVLKVPVNQYPQAGRSGLTHFSEQKVTELEIITQILFSFCQFFVCVVSHLKKLQQFVH